MSAVVTSDYSNVTGGQLLTFNLGTHSNSSFGTIRVGLN